MIATTETIASIVAKTLRPKPKMKPSEWAERHRVVHDSPSPGRWSNDYLPWLEPILDVYLDEPERDGWLFMKPAQVGASEIMVTLILYLSDLLPGPMLYICSTAEQAKGFSTGRFGKAINDSPHLKRLWAERSTEEERKTTIRKPYSGGYLALTGSGSESGVVSNPMRYVVLDEYDLLKDFPTLGAAPRVAEKRTAEYRTRCRTGIFGFAHPTTPDRGIAAAMDTQADRREWTFDCPNCGEPWSPKWEHVKGLGDRNPDDARLECPSCHKAISDAERWSATRKGRFVSVMAPDEAKRRRFVGFHVTKLCHPRVTLRELAVEYCECRSESDLRVFFNMSMGEPYQDASLVLTEESIVAKAESGERRAARAVPSSCRLVTIGVDVQYPHKRPTMYVRADAWLTDGNDFVIEYLKLAGWDALEAYAATFEVELPDGSKLKPIGCGIDSGWLTDEVYSFCRRRPAALEWVPMKYDGSVKPDAPVRQKRITDPTRPELGRMLRLELCRGYWMDRQAGRFAPDSDPTIGGSVIVPGSVRRPIDQSREFVAHIKANHRVSIVDENGHEKLIWNKDKGERDDWFQAGVYGEVVAVAHGLDRWHEEPPPPPAERVSEVERGLERDERFSGRTGRLRRGRRNRRGRVR